MFYPNLSKFQKIKFAFCTFTQIYIGNKLRQILPSSLEEPVTQIHLFRLNDTIYRLHTWLVSHKYWLSSAPAHWCQLFVCRPEYFDSFWKTEKLVQITVHGT